MLILLSFLLKQHKVWSNCTTRVFTVAQMSDNSVQLRKDLKMFLYDLRIDAEVYVEEMNDQDISAYTVEMTLDMQNRIKMLKQIKSRKFSQNRSKTNELASTKSITNHMIKKESIQEIRSPNESDSVLNLALGVQRPLTPLLPGGAYASSVDGEIDEEKLKRMHTAIKLNESIRNHSSNADLVIVNFPTPPEKYDGQHCYMEYLDVLSSGIPRVLMVRGSGMEVVTIYS
ncbi:Solute carrier family 12 member 4 [Lamellibrachia satsuma]|nr:Solute carrier family 12 member 4 [Lamellibrachia satsuma]